MKVISMYLPQFHRIPENDAWWGKGFTDWQSAQNAKPCFEGHYQPHLPKDNFFYDLSKQETLLWQADMMRKYEVDGLCFYHYWFEGGRKILEKPAENLLQWKDVNMPFCFAWANETWARSWSGIKDANVWSNLLEKDHRGNAILLKQGYGDKNAWKEHFSYLLPFFQDERYIKIDGKPLFVIYKSGIIGCLAEMLECWRKLAVEAGLMGVYVIGAFCKGAARDYVDGELIHEPVSSINVLGGGYSNEIKRVSYIQLWNEILKRPKKVGTYYGGFVGYDDTPRRGIEGVVVENASPYLFGGFLAQLMAKNEAAGSEITFLNAWNEWGEGMHLEPDQKYDTQYLEQVAFAKANYQEYISFYKKDLILSEDREEKFELYLNDLDKWLYLRERKESIANWLEQHKYENVAIYGYGIMGRHLYWELKDSGVNISCIIDKQSDKIHADVPVISPNEIGDNLDVIIVSSYYFFNTIRIQLGLHRIVFSLGDIINSLYEKYL